MSNRTKSTGTCLNTILALQFGEFIVDLAYSQSKRNRHKNFGFSCSALIKNGDFSEPRECDSSVFISKHLGVSLKRIVGK